MHELTEQTKLASDMSAPSVSLGGGQQIQHLDNKKYFMETGDKNGVTPEPKVYYGPLEEEKKQIDQFDEADIPKLDIPQPIFPEPEEPYNPTKENTTQQKEPEKTQGEYQAELDSIIRQIDTNNSRIETLNSFINDVSKWNENTNIYKEIGNLRSILGDDIYKELSSVIGSLNGKSFHQIKSIVIEHARDVIGNIEKANAPLTTRKYEIETSSSYDNRPYEDIRADTAYQRAVEDMTKAGLNKYGLSGGVSFGGSSSSKSDEEEEKKKKKKRELEEARRRAEEMRRAEEIRKSNDMMKILGVIAGLTGTTGLVGSSVFNALERTKQAQIYADSRNVDTVTQTYDRNGELANQTYKEYVRKRK